MTARAYQLLVFGSGSAIGGAVIALLPLPPRQMLGAIVLEALAIYVSSSLLSDDGCRCKGAK